MSKSIEITRYPNRRLYDRNQKKYVTLSDLESMVLEGHDVRVKDSKSNEDLTRAILIQILIERHPERVELFPVTFLQEILRADQMGLDWLKLYLGQAKAVMDGLGNNASGSLFPGMDLWRAMMPGGFRAAPTSRATSPDEAAPPTSEPAPGDEPTPDELAAKLAELEARLKQLEGGDSQDSK